jgi:hypothetical protein
MQGVSDNKYYGASRGYATGHQCTWEGPQAQGLANGQAQKSPRLAG